MNLVMINIMNKLEAVNTLNKDIIIKHKLQIQGQRLELENANSKHLVRIHLLEQQLVDVQGQYNHLQTTIDALIEHSKEKETIIDVKNVIIIKLEQRVRTMDRDRQNQNAFDARICGLQWIPDQQSVDGDNEDDTHSMADSTACIEISDVDWDEINNEQMSEMTETTRSSTDDNSDQQHPEEQMNEAHESDETKNVLKSEEVPNGSIKM